jgi:undecaprenyl-diphosphatase
MDFLQVLILAVLQGITEFLPISSSAHLILLPHLMEWSDQGLAFDIAVHFGTLVAVVTYFYKDLHAISAEWGHSLSSGRQTPSSRLFWGIVLATVPIGLSGLFLKEVVETHLRSSLYIAIGLIGFGLLLSWADWRKRGSGDEYNLTLAGMIFIGCAQVLALFPGTSRSGITITAALLLGLGREGASRFSFLLSIPVILLSSVFQLIQFIGIPEPIEWTPLLAGAVIAAISAMACIHFFLAFIRRIGMQPFVAYRMVLGVVLLGML